MFGLTVFFDHTVAGQRMLAPKGMKVAVSLFLKLLRRQMLVEREKRRNPFSCTRRKNEVEAEINGEVYWTKRRCER